MSPRSSARLSARDRKVLVIGAAACLTLIGATRGLPMLLRWTRDARASAAQLDAEATRARASVVHAKETRDSLGARNERYLELATRLLDRQTSAGAGGSLASLVSDAAAETNVRLGSVQIRADTNVANAFTHLMVHADLTGDIRGLANMMATLEKGPTLLAIREMAISQPELAAGDERAEVLHAELVVEGLMPTSRGGKVP